jgi:hypothetical protein
MTHVTCNVLKTIEKKGKKRKNHCHILCRPTQAIKKFKQFLIHTQDVLLYFMIIIISYIELNECTLKPKQNGIINELFPGVPSDVNGVFRYRNGILYFLKKKDNTESHFIGI